MRVNNKLFFMNSLKGSLRESLTNQATEAPLELKNSFLYAIEQFYPLPARGVG